MIFREKCSSTLLTFTAIRGFRGNITRLLSVFLIVYERLCSLIRWSSDRLKRVLARGLKNFHSTPLGLISHVLHFLLNVRRLHSDNLDNSSFAATASRAMQRTARIDAYAPEEPVCPRGTGAQKIRASIVILECRGSPGVGGETEGGRRGMKGAEGLGYLRGRDTTQVLHCCVVIVVGIRVVDP